MKLNNQISAKSPVSFPVSLPCNWQPADQTFVPDPLLKNWLLDTGSLTERLQSQCMKFELCVIGQRQMQPEVEEMKQFSLPNDGKFQIREVILSGNDQPWVFARSVLPQALCDMDLANLGNRPLGKIIFNDARFVRQPFQLLKITPNDAFQHHVKVNPLFQLWGRRSVFQFEQMQLMVAEVFLPRCPAYRQLHGE